MFDLSNMTYCEQNVSLSDWWVQHGLSHCLLSTIQAVWLTTIMALFGTIELVMYYRHGQTRAAGLRQWQCVYCIQYSAHVCLIGLPLVWLASHWLPLLASPVCGYELVGNTSQTVLWMYCLIILHCERTYVLPSPPSRGHGVLLLIFWTSNLVFRLLAFVSLNSQLWWWKLHHLGDQLQLGLFIFELLCVLVVFGLGLDAPGLPTALHTHLNMFSRSRTTTDQQALIVRSVPIIFVAWGGASASTGSTWANLWSKLRMVAPYLWPRHSCLLQCYVLCNVLLLVMGRVVNVFVPILYKLIVDSLASQPNLHSAVRTFRWDYIVYYCALRAMQGSAMSGGLLSVIRNFLWIRVQQYTTREVQVKLFAHLHELSLRWHVGRKTGEVFRVMDRGTQSISTLLNYLLFSILPTIVDILIAIVYFISFFSGWFGLLVLITMLLYIVATIGITEWRTKFRRQMNELDNKSRTIAMDSMLNFETVKYYNSEQYEVDRYKKSLLDYQEAEWTDQASLALCNVTQNAIISVGLLVGSLLCAHMVVYGTDSFTVGDYVLFATYMMQLYAPLNVFGMLYRQIQASLVNMENMFDLLNENLEIKDVPDAQEMKISNGRMEFRNVSFRYLPTAPVIENISFVVEPGQTFALVGPSGGGKSTIIRLLFRFYDVQEGQILLDGQDISLVQQHSLRRFIGVVPQDTVLFNATIHYNIQYGRHEADDEQVKQSAAAADIHDKILSFPDAYDTMVGERGLRLSGGEKQRVAIARTILKAPEYILLDEATSALDTHTERNIQASLTALCAGRTTLVVAHRLSTITHADMILVLDKGAVVERGRHEDLLSQGGLYADMWQQQSVANNQTIKNPQNNINNS